MKLRLGPVLACLLFAPSFAAYAEDNPPPAADLLFEAPQLANTKPGDELETKVWITSKEQGSE